MGIDACIEFKIREGAEPPELWLPNGLSITPAGGWCETGATHEVDNTWRYYGEGYERGPWPEIASVLMKLLADPDIETVWYFGDSRDSADPFTIGDLFALTLHYLANGERPYRAGAPRVVLEWPKPQECP